jgi:hypothetical protein
MVSKQSEDSGERVKGQPELNDMKRWKAIFSVVIGRFPRRRRLEY